MFIVLYKKGIKFWVFEWNFRVWLLNESVGIIKLFYNNSYVKKFVRSEKFKVIFGLIYYCLN